LDDLEKISSHGTQVVVPSKKQASKKGIKRFDKDHFKYIKDADEYECPSGNRFEQKELIMNRIYHTCCTVIDIVSPFHYLCPPDSISRNTHPGTKKDIPSLFRKKPNKYTSFPL